MSSENTSSNPKDKEHTVGRAGCGVLGGGQGEEEERGKRRGRGRGGGGEGEEEGRKRRGVKIVQQR